MRPLDRDREPDEDELEKPVGLAQTCRASEFFDRRGNFGPHSPLPLVRERLENAMDSPRFQVRRLPDGSDGAVRLPVLGPSGAPPPRPRPAVRPATAVVLEEEGSPRRAALQRVTEEALDALVMGVLEGPLSRVRLGTA